MFGIQRFQPVKVLVNYKQRQGKPMPGTCWCPTVPLYFENVAEITRMQVILRGVLYSNYAVHTIKNEFAQKRALGALYAVGIVGLISL